MKTSIQKIVFLLTLIPQLALAEAGGSANGGRGGGTTMPSEPAQIKAALRQAKKSDLSRAFERVYKRIDSVTDPVARMAFERLFNPTGSSDPEAKSRGLQRLFKDIADSTYGYQDAPCHDHIGADKDGSAKLGDEGGLICFSYSQIKRIGAAALPSEMLALAAHEHAHHLGLNELEAKAIQDFFIRHPSIVRHNLFSGMLANRRSSLSWQVSVAANALTESASDAVLCQKLGLIEGIAESMSSEVGIEQDAERRLPFEAPPASDDAQAMIHDAYIDAYGIAGFCEKRELPKYRKSILHAYPAGRVPPQPSFVDLGDRSTLAPRLKALAESLDRLDPYLDLH